MASIRVSDRRLPVERRVAAYLSKGSVEPLAGRCGRRKRQAPDFPEGTPYRYCEAKTNGPCRVHGGASLVGPASPTFKDGRYSKLFRDGPLGRGYEAARADESTLTSLAEQIYVAEARLEELAGQIAEAARGRESAWVDVRQASARVVAIARQPNADPAAFARALEQLEQVARGGAGYDRLWAQWHKTTALVRRLKDTQAKIMSSGRGMVPVEHALAWGRQIAELAIQAMASDNPLRAFTDGLRRLQAGRMVEDARAIVASPG